MEFDNVLVAWDVSSRFWIYKILLFGLTRFCQKQLFTHLPGILFSIGVTVAFFYSLSNNSRHLLVYHVLFLVGV
ncbi:MAG: hypothetical protein ACI9V1_002982, partial [Spirosomataceae bacterium]